MTVTPVNTLPEDFTLARGGHRSLEAGACLLEAASYIAGEPFSDHPKCVSPFLTGMGIRLNDSLPADERQKLTPLIPRLLNTAGDGKDQARKYMRVDWNIRIALSAIFEALGRTEVAEKFRALDPVVDVESYSALRAAVSTQLASSRKKRDELWAEIQRKRAAGEVITDADAYAYAYADAYAYAYSDAYAKRASLRSARLAENKAKLEPVVAQLRQSKIDLFAAMIDPA